MSPKIPKRNQSPFGWWLASYIQRFEYKDARSKSPSSRCLAWENTIIVKAKNLELAYRKAITIGKQNSALKWSRYGSTPGRLGRWKFEGLTSFLPIYEELLDGSEIAWDEHRGTTLGAVQKRVKAKHELDTFSDKEPR